MSDSEIIYLRLAELTARLDAGEPREEILREVDLEESQFLDAQQRWLALIGNAVLRGEFELQRKYSAQYNSSFQRARGVRQEEEYLGMRPIVVSPSAAPPSVAPPLASPPPVIAPPPLASPSPVVAPPPSVSPPPVIAPPPLASPPPVIAPPPSVSPPQVVAPPVAPPQIVTPPPVLAPPQVSPSQVFDPSQVFAPQVISPPAMAPSVIISPPPVVTAPAMASPQVVSPTSTATPAAVPAFKIPPAVVSAQPTIPSLAKPIAVAVASPGPPPFGPGSSDTAVSATPPALITPALLQPPQVVAAVGELAGTLPPTPTTIASHQGSGSTADINKNSAGRGYQRLPVSFSETGFGISAEGLPALSPKEPPTVLQVAPAATAAPLRAAMPSLKPLPQRLDFMSGGKSTEIRSAGAVVLPPEGGLPVLGEVTPAVAPSFMQSALGTTPLASPARRSGSPLSNVGAEVGPALMTASMKLSLEQLACIQAELDRDPSRLADVLQSNSVDEQAYIAQRKNLENEMTSDVDLSTRFAQFREYYRAVLGPSS